MQTLTIVQALEQLTADQIDRLRCRLWRRFAAQLSKVPDAPDPDDLLQEAYQDLLVDKRHCPAEQLDLARCLFNIVRSKVSHLYDAWKKEGMIKESVDVLEYQSNVSAHVDDSALRAAILEQVQDDPLLLRIVEYRLDHAEEEPIKAQKMAMALGASLSDMYNANRRLKARLASLV